MTLPQRQPRREPPVPTGPELLALVLRSGNAMLAAETHAVYLDKREKFIYLLTIAEHDQYCIERLIPAVQGILDAESQMFRDKSG